MNLNIISVFFFFLSLTVKTSRAKVAKSDTFTYTNSGEFGPYIIEYGADYRTIPIFASPFQLFFYNNTPNAYTLAIRIGTSRSESLRRFVWEANRSNPVDENATFSLKQDGNLVLAHSDGRIAWQTNTANKGVVKFEFLPNGNMVLVDKSGRFVWQSFDSATDTILVGQTIRNHLVSRLSETENKDGPYRLVPEPNGFSLYYKSMLYFSTHADHDTNLTLLSEPDYGNFSWELSLGSILYVGRPKYNATYSLLRLGIDGSLKVYTFYDKVFYQAWEVVYTLFYTDFFWHEGCQLPEKCGNFGVCEENQCVACPSERGLLGWSKNCAAKKVSCDPSKFEYYKVEGVDHFLSKYNRGSDVKESDCAKKCTSDCKCLGYFYNRDTSRCFIAPELKTLTKVANSSHVGFIKTPKTLSYL